MEKKKIILLVIISILILLGIYMLYNTFASYSTITNSNDTYIITLNEDNNTITIPSNSSKTVYYHIKNTNKGTVKYGVGYNSDTNIEVKVYSDSVDKVTDFIEYGGNKYIKLYLNNISTADSSVTLSTILGYENGGDLIVPSGVSLVSKIMNIINENAATYITSLYTNADKSTVENNSITYNYASSESLMNDRLGGKSSSLDGGHIRYYGADPNNYIYFNCSDYSNQTSDTCELWRIIGVFGGKLKIMKNSIIGTYSWDSSDSTVNNGHGINEWSQADLMKLLNPEYEDEEVGGSLYYNGGAGNCYSDLENTTKECDFTEIGIKNDETRNKITTVTWNTGSSNNSSVYSNIIYQKERGNEVIEEPNDEIIRTTTWLGKIALIYPSDYGYATDFTKCSKTLWDYGSSDDSYACRSNDWMYPIVTNSGSVNTWLITADSDLSFDAWRVYAGGGLSATYAGCGYSRGVTPTLYLNSDEILDIGTGESSDPYRLK